MFSRKASAAAGRPVGFGNGRLISYEALREKHGLDQHRLPLGSATITFPESDQLPEGQHQHHNPAPVLGREQKRDAKAASDAMRQEKFDARRRHREAQAEKRRAAFCSVLKYCDVCGAGFKHEGHLRRHVAADCGRFKRKLERRIEHDAGTVRSLVKLHDDDLADEAEVAEELGLDLVTITVTSADVGWTLSDSVESAPAEFSGLDWSLPTTIDDAPDGALVRVSGLLFEEQAKVDSKEKWRSSFYYGWSKGRKPRAGPGVITVKYTDGYEFDSHITLLEIGRSSDVALVKPNPAVITAVTSRGQAHRSLIRAGMTVMSVGGVDTPTLATARGKLSNVTCSEAAPLKIVLRRQAVRMYARGSARSAANRRRQYVWGGSLLEELEALLMNPSYERRVFAVRGRLKENHRYELDLNGRVVLPPLKVIESKTIAIFKRKKEARRNNAQNSAARAVARAARAAGTDEGDDDSVVGSDDEGDDDDTNADPAGSDSTGGEAAAAGDNGDGAVKSHYNNLEGAKVSELRARLREGNAELATVRAADIDSGLEGPAKSAAVLDVLRQRLAQVLAADDA